MKRLTLLLLPILIASVTFAQNRQSSIPEAALRKGYGVQKTIYANLDSDSQAEEIILFGHDNGHWPEFDIFKSYFAVLDSRTREVKYLSEEYRTDRYNIRAEDRDGDGIDEIYYYCLDEDRFSCDPDGFRPVIEHKHHRLCLAGEEKARKASCCKKDKQIKALVIAGQDGSHYYRGAADCIKQILENSGRFTVDVLITPDWGEDMSSFHPEFKDYGLVILNYGGVEWAEEVKKDFESYVEKGGGVVFIHSSIIPMENWVEYNRMSGLGAWNGRDEKWGPFVYYQDGKLVRDYSPGWAGFHALQHHVTVDHQVPEHPILQGLPKSWHHYKDEIYTRLRGPAENIEILATTHDNGRDEPVLWTVKYGKGRVFVDVLGHCGNDPNMTYAMTCAGYQVTLIRGCEWAATGKVSPDYTVDFPDADHFSLRRDFKAPVE